MKNKRDYRYKNMRRAIVASASGSIMAGMLFVGVGGTAYAETANDTFIPAYSQNTSTTGMHLMHKWNSPAKINSLASSLGLDPNTVKAELKAGKTFKQILQENGVVPAQIQKAFSKQRKSAMKRMMRNNTL